MGSSSIFSRNGDVPSIEVLAQQTPEKLQKLRDEARRKLKARQRLYGAHPEDAHQLGFLMDIEVIDGALARHSACASVSAPPNQDGSFLMGEKPIWTSIGYRWPRDKVPPQEEITRVAGLREGLERMRSSGLSDKWKRAAEDAVPRAIQDGGRSLIALRSSKTTTVHETAHM